MVIEVNSFIQKNPQPMKEEGLKDNKFNYLSWHDST